MRHRCVDDYVFFWKPQGIPTTFGKQTSFLEQIIKSPLKDLLDPSLHEYGLLNRLDNDTSGLLYFARSGDTYNRFKELQQEDKIIKVYYAWVYGIVTIDTYTIKTPICHRKDSSIKMVTGSPSEQKTIITSKNKYIPYTGHLHYVQTHYKCIEHNIEHQTSLLEIHITKGMRHQIRCHLANYLHPIINDVLYASSSLRKLDISSQYIGLQLTSSGIFIDS